MTMAAPDEKPVLRDGNLSFASGVDASQSPTFITRAQVQAAVNCTMRGGPAKPRPGLDRIGLTYGTNLALPFQRGLFQHADFYNGNGYPSLMASISGRLFKIDCSTWDVTDITPAKSSIITLTADFT